MNFIILPEVVCLLYYLLYNYINVLVFKCKPLTYSILVISMNGFENKINFNIVTHALKFVLYRSYSF